MNKGKWKQREIKKIHQEILHTHPKPPPPKTGFTNLTKPTLILSGFCHQSTSRNDTFL